MRKFATFTGLVGYLSSLLDEEATYETLQEVLLILQEEGIAWQDDWGRWTLESLSRAQLDALVHKAMERLKGE